VEVGVGYLCKNYHIIFFKNMSNLSVNIAECIWLGENIIAIYKKNDPQLRPLTGTIGIYERIAEFIQQFIKSLGDLTDFENELSESYFKSELSKKGLFTEKVSSVSRYYANAVSSNVLRKLLFDAPKSEKDNIVFKEDFIFACYVFLKTDRMLVLDILKEKSEQQIGVKDTDGKAIGKTIDPYSLRISEILKKSDKTIDPFKKENYFMFVPLNSSNELDEKKPLLSFEGNRVIINRDNIDPSNNTITGKEQAEITKINDQWVIVNKSDLKTTYFQINRSLIINDGDIIVVGDRRFMFKIKK
jgi:hypothetical protein